MLISRDDGLSTIRHSCVVFVSSDGAKKVSWPWLSLIQQLGSLAMAFTAKFVSLAHHIIFLRFNPFDIRVDREGWWFEDSMSYLHVCLSADGAKNFLLALVISALRLG